MFAQFRNASGLIMSNEEYGKEDIGKDASPVNR